MDGVDVIEKSAVGAVFLLCLHIKQFIFPIVLNYLYRFIITPIISPVLIDVLRNADIIRVLY
jgi:hypothetical protein